MSDICSVEINDIVINEYSQRYIEITSHLAKRLKFDFDALNISKKSLAKAFANAGKDIDIMIFRRKPESISPSKIAGKITFRLAKAF
ncbi:MAG: hypothetical protein HQK79_18490 [Desulfobacterales bacterium]|nr:hypothetical protein [Desulfobacterales bacterium]